MGRELMGMTESPGFGSWCRWGPLGCVAGHMLWVRDMTREREMGAEVIGLDPRQFQGMNHAFYKGDPAGYFETRNASLLLHLANSDELKEVYGRGVSYGKMRMAGVSAATDEDRDGYGSVESLVLLHHASEALIRLFLAHRSLGACPWLEVARLRSFAKFKQEAEALSELVDSEEVGRQLVDVFRGGREATAGSEVEKDEDLRGLRSLVGGAAQRLLSEGNVYNSAKHGLALIPQTLGLSIDLGDPTVEVGNDGPSLTYLEIRDGTWYESVSFVNAESNIGLTTLILQQIRSLWSVARARYLSDFAGRVFPLSVELVDQLTTGHWKKPFHLPGYSMSLAYLETEDDQASTSS